MGKQHHNYSKDFQKNKDDEFMNPPVADETTDVEDEAVVTPTIGIVCNCERLNVRKQPSTDSNILCVINEGDELQVVAENGEWVNVCTSAGIEGYCMSKFVAVGV